MHDERRPNLQASLRDMSLFVAAYEKLSFTAAAISEYATQSGVSQHVLHLENTFGTKLFTRRGGKIAPTSAGHCFYNHCIEVLRAQAIAVDAVRQYARGVDGEISVGFIPAMTRCALTPILRRFSQEHPNVIIRIVEGSSPILTQQVHSGQLDFAVISAFAGAPGLRCRFLLRTPEVLVSRRGTSLVHGAPVRLSDLGPLKLVLVSKANARRARLESYFASNGVKVERFLELDSMFGTLDFIARTEWMTIVASLVMMDENEASRFTVNPIVKPSLNLDLMVIEPARKPLSGAAKAFLQIAEDETHGIAIEWNRSSNERLSQKAPASLTLAKASSIAHRKRSNVANHRQTKKHA